MTATHHVLHVPRPLCFQLRREPLAFCVSFDRDGVGQSVARAGLSAFGEMCRNVAVRVGEGGREAGNRVFGRRRWRNRVLWASERSANRATSSE